MEILRKYGRNNILIKYDGNKYRRYKSNEWYHEPKFFDEYTRYLRVVDPSSLENKYKRMIRRIKLENILKD